MANTVVNGVEQVIRAIGAARVKDAINIHKGIDKGLDAVLKLAKHYVPVEFDDLRQTGRKVVTGSGFGTRGKIEFGGTAPSGREVDYAVYVHEIEEAYHELPTCWKYAERAVRECKPTLSRILKRQILTGR